MNTLYKGIYEGTFHSLVTDALRETVKSLVESELAAGNLDDGMAHEFLCAEQDVMGNCLEALPVLGVIRGFRYGTSVLEGEPITLEKLYQVIPIGPYIVTDSDDRTRRYELAFDLRVKS